MLGRLSLACVVVSFSVGCVLPADAARERELYRSLNPTDGIVVFSAGSAERLSRSDSFSVIVQDLDGDTAAIQQALIKRIRQRFPTWQYRSDRMTADVVIDWQSGFSICLDCGEERITPQWARVQIEVHHGLARAEWTGISHWRSRSRLVNLFVVALDRAKNERAA